MPIPSWRLAVDATELESHLSRIETRWTAVLDAQRGPSRGAQHELLRRYGGAAHRFLLAVTGDAELADDLAQEFALRFLRGDFRHADPARGRFRDYLKRALRNLALEHRKRAVGRLRSMGQEIPEPGDDGAAAGEWDRQFRDSWRQTLLDHAWRAIADAQKADEPPYHDVLRLRADHPELRSEALAERLSAHLGRPVTAGWVRQVLRRARARFVAALQAEVERSLELPTADEVERELGEIGLLDYCRPAMHRRGTASERGRGTDEAPRRRGGDLDDPASKDTNL
jgi:RNA polymerase sigma-70 factor (ECF subfamily)